MTGWLHCGKVGWQQEGFVSLWRGITPTLYWAFLCNAALFYTYDVLSRQLSDEAAEDDSIGSPMP